MTAELLAAVIDTLLPGDDGEPPLPSGTAAGVTARLANRLDAPSSGATAVIEAAASRLGGPEAFARADAALRTSALGEVQAEMPEAFASLVTLALYEYYESEPVLLAMGWRVQPPQPLGHPVLPFDEALLEPVRRRARMWRDAEGP